MTLEAILSYLHLLAILTMVVFVASEAALCRVQWLNAAVVERLAKVDRIYGIAALAVITALRWPNTVTWVHVAVAVIAPVAAETIHLLIH